MNDTPIMTPEVIEAQRKVAVKAERDAELVAVAAMAFGAGRAVTTARAQQEKEE